MRIWIDAQLSPIIADWINNTFPFQAVAVRDIGLRDATDIEIFQAARQESAIVMTKDMDFVRLLEERGPPPLILWITCGNTSNTRLKEILSGTLTKALKLIRDGEKLVEIHAE
jgi:predicted nuclease of predicted toxin-antitoxin system